MALNPYIPSEPQKKREYGKLKPKWVPNQTKSIISKPLPEIDRSKIKFHRWKYVAKLPGDVSIEGEVKGLTIASAAFAAGQEVMKTYKVEDVDELTVTFDA